MNGVSPPSVSVEQAFLEEAMVMFANITGPQQAGPLTNEAWQRWSDWRWAVDAHLKGTEPPAGVATRRSQIGS